MKLEKVKVTVVWFLILSLGLSHSGWTQEADELADPYTQEMIQKINEGYKNDIKGKSKLSSQIAIKFAGERSKQAFNHSLLKDPSERKSELTSLEKIPRVDVWRYEYKNPKTGEIMNDSSPISTKKEFWKNQHEARIIALTFYGSIQKYFDGLMDFLNSISHIKKVNGIPEKIPFGYETFTLRVYVAKRNPNFAHLGPLKNSTSEEFIKLLLEKGCEIAYVDNHQEKVGRDATFWRFLIADEKMPEGQSIRYLSRDVDHKVTAAELFTVGEWIRSGFNYHRMHLNTSFVGPLTASIFGGVHKGSNGISEMKKKIELFPYRWVYGDDEIFTKYVIWDHMKTKGSILTHKYVRGLAYELSNPYHGSSEDTPTGVYCHGYTQNPVFPHALDLILPKGLKFPMMYLAHDLPLEKIDKKYLKLKNIWGMDRLGKTRVKKAMETLYEDGQPSSDITKRIGNGKVQHEPDPVKLLRQLNKIHKMIKHQ